MHRLPVLVLATLLTSTAIAAAESPTPTVEPAPAPAAKHVGVGYKIGNGIGFLGADLVVNVAPHVGVDLQGSYISMKASNGDTGTGYGFAPAVHGELYTGQRSTPYVAVGLQYAHLAVSDAAGSGYGGFANVGYEWKWQSGLGIQLGGGIQYLQKVEASNGTTMLMTGGKANPNIEFGLRYMFL